MLFRWLGERLADHRNFRVHAAAGALLVAGVLIGYFTTTHYGESWDEPNNATYGYVSLKAYAGSPDFLTYGRKVYYGPFYLMIWSLGSRALKIIHTGWTQIDAGHFFNFLTFLVGVAGFYVICLKFLRPIVALGATLLLATQPLLYGYAFMNPKDIPFMVLLTLAVAAGLVAIDNYPWKDDTERDAAADRWWRSRLALLRDDIQRSGEVVRNHLYKTLGVIFVLGVWISVISGFPFRAWISGIVRGAYYGESWPLVNRLFAGMAQNRNSLPVEAYVAKAMTLYLELRILLAVGLIVASIAGLKHLLAGSLGDLNRGWVRRQVPILFAGCLIGFATSVRIAGPIAGLLICGYAILKVGRKAIVPLIFLTGAAVLAMYITWPYLWSDPIGHFTQTFGVMSDFQSHTVLYRGSYLSSASLPWDYAPNLLGLELTLPVVALFIWGSLVLCRRLLAGRVSSALASVPILWLAIPLLAFLILRTPIYGNIRQLLFAAPPLVLLGAIGLSDLWQRLRKPLLQWVLLGALLVPGIWGILSLHPYEYIYFNALAGGVRGADGVYDLDLWCTSYREAIGYVNDSAPEGASVVVWGPLPLAKDFARGDLKLSGEGEADSPLYALGCKRALDQEGFYATYQTVYQVTRDQAVLAVVKER